MVPVTGHFGEVIIIPSREQDQRAWSCVGARLNRIYEHYKDAEPINLGTNNHEWRGRGCGCLLTGWYVIKGDQIKSRPERRLSIGWCAT